MYTSYTFSIHCPAKDHAMLLQIAFSTLHFALAFIVIGALAAELALLQPGLTKPTLRRLGRIDAVYGLSFGVLVAVGLIRAIWFEKGWSYYASSPGFWAKMALLAVITLLSLPPTFRYIRWNRAAELPDTATILSTRRLLWAEAGLLALIPVFAGLMARGS
jgi:putative membrane protein